MDRVRFFRINLEEVVAKLRAYFEGREEVSIAILFGSALRRSSVRDIDVAVPGAGDLRTLFRIADDLEALLRVPVDVVPLAQLPPEMRLVVLTRGLPLAVRDRGLYTELIKTAVGELEDLRAVRRATTG